MMMELTNEKLAAVEFGAMSAKQAVFTEAYGKLQKGQIGSDGLFDAAWGAASEQQGATIAALNQQLVAARNEALEEAASIMAPVWGIGCAAAIRALAPHPAAPVQPVSAYSVAVSIRAAQGWNIDGGPVPILYTDEINGQQVCRDDVFLCKTEHLTKAAPPVQQTGDAHDQVGCEGDDGLLRVHAASTTCDVCATTRPSAALTILQEICEMQERHYGDGMETHLALINLCDKARAILAASGGALAVPDGYVVAPKEPTQEMLDNIAAFYTGCSDHAANIIYRAMIAAAPTTQDTTKG